MTAAYFKVLTVSQFGDFRDILTLQTDCVVHRLAK